MIEIFVFFPVIGDRFYNNSINCDMRLRNLSERVGGMNTASTIAFLSLMPLGEI